MDRTLELEVKPRLLLKVGDKEYTVEYPLSAVVRAEASTSRSLKSLADWFELKCTDVGLVLHAGLVQAHPEVQAEEITALCEALGTEGVLEIRHALMCLNFPRTMQKFEDQIRNKKSPNV